MNDDFGWRRRRARRAAAARKKVVSDGGRVVLTFKCTQHLTRPIHIVVFSFALPARRGLQAASSSPSSSSFNFACVSFWRSLTNSSQKQQVRRTGRGGNRNRDTRSSATLFARCCAARFVRAQRPLAARQRSPEQKSGDTCLRARCGRRDSAGGRRGEKKR